MFHVQPLCVMFIIFIVIFIAVFMHVIFTARQSYGHIVASARLNISFFGRRYAVKEKVATNDRIASRSNLARGARPMRNFNAK